MPSVHHQEGIKSSTIHLKYTKLPSYSKMLIPQGNMHSAGGGLHVWLLYGHQGSNQKNIFSRAVLLRVQNALRTEPPYHSLNIVSNHYYIHRISSILSIRSSHDRIICILISHARIIWFMSKILAQTDSPSPYYKEIFRGQGKRLSAYLFPY